MSCQSLNYNHCVEELAELERWASVENWSGKRKADGTRTAKAESEQAVNSLKINRDLLLVSPLTATQSLLLHIVCQMHRNES